MSSITTQPLSNILRASDKLCFTISQEDIGEAPISKQGIYQLKCVDTDEFLMKEPSMFRGPKPMPIDLMEMVRCRLRTTVPQINQLGMFEDLTGKKQVQLHIGESVQDADDCNNNTCELTGTSEVYTVVNSYCPQYDLDILGEGEILATMPKVITVCSGTNDWIWVCGKAQINIETTTLDGATVFSSFSPESGLNYISIGPNNVEFNGPVTGVINRDRISCMKIYRDGILVSTVIVEKCSCRGCNNQLYFLDPKGSIRGMGVFKEISNKGIDTTGQEICRQESCATSIQDAYAYFGTRYMSKGAWERVTLTQKFCIDCDNEEFYRAFSSATTFWIEKNGQLLGFILDSRPTSYRVSDDLTEISITGHIARQFPTNLIN